MLFQTWKFNFRGVGKGKPRKANGLYLSMHFLKVFFFLLFFVFVAPLIHINVILNLKVEF